MREMDVQMRPGRALIIALLLGCGSAVQLEAPQCDFTTVFSLRSDWGSSDEPCHGKLPFDLWTLMKAEGSAQDSDAQYVREYCTQTQQIGLVELITPEGYTESEGVKAAPGDIVSETKHASTYAGATATTFEAFCNDESISRVTRVTAILEASVLKKRGPGRRLKASLSEGGQAHQVAELISGLQDLGCTRTTGEDQTVCVISDSFDRSGNAADLQASGDLPQVEVVKELPLNREGIDEGSAMLELMYDIASGSTYKFNTGFIGEQTFADDLNILSDEEGCDVIVDDVGISDEPAFRDGVMAVAVDEAVDSGNLYFSSAGNSGFGHRFTSDFECADGFQVIFEDSPGCGTGVPSHVFQPDVTHLGRYFYPFTVSADVEMIYAHWDADIDTTEDVVLVFYQEVLGTDQLFAFAYGDVVSGKAWEMITLLPDLTNDGSLDPAFQYYLQIVHMGSEANDIEADFLLRASNGGLGFGVSGESDGSIYGHACASSCIAVGAIDWVGGDGSAGAFEDPEMSPVEGFSSRGPCIVNGETRSKPTTSAADGLTTSHPSLDPFFGTSASAPVAAAIATIVRAACFPTVVGNAEMMEMLTNYDYTIDYTNDADGAAETWGADAGFGIISAAQMLAWVEANCSAACPGAGSTPTSAPTTAPVSTPAPTLAPVETPSPTTAPVDANTPSPTTAPVETTTPTMAPVDTSTSVPTAAPLEPSTPTTAPVDTSAPTIAPVETPSPTTAPVNTNTPSPTTAPVETTTPTMAPVDTPTSVPTAAPLEPSTPTAAPVNTSAPTIAPVETPSPTIAPEDTRTPSPTTAPVETSTPTMAPADTSTSVPSSAPLEQSSPTTAPVNMATPEPISTDAPLRTTSSPEVPRTAAPVDVEEPESPPTPPPTPSDSMDDDDVRDDEEPEDDDDSGYVEVGTKTTVTITASAYDERSGQDSGDGACGEDGCLPALAHDGIGEDDLESRWSCAEDIVPGGGQCEIVFSFGSPQDIMDVEVAFFKGDERTRTLKVTLNGDKIGEFESPPGSISSSLGIQQNGVDTVTLESLGIDQDEWIGLLEVRFLVEP